MGRTGLLTLFGLDGHNYSVEQFRVRVPSVSTRMSPVEHRCSGLLVQLAHSNIWMGLHANISFCVGAFQSGHDVVM